MPAWESAVHWALGRPDWEALGVLMIAIQGSCFRIVHHAFIRPFSSWQGFLARPNGIQAKRLVHVDLHRRWCEADVVSRQLSLVLGLDRHA